MCICKKGFTLVELLVVVLIIGILSSVAVAQYRRAVRKARLAQLDVLMDTVKKSVDLYLLNNGMPADGVVRLSGPESVADIEASVNCDDEWCYTPSGGFELSCGADACRIRVETKRTSATNSDGWLDYATLEFVRDSSGTWYVDSFTFEE